MSIVKIKKRYKQIFGVDQMKLFSNFGYFQIKIYICFQFETEENDKIIINTQFIWKVKIYY